MSEPRFCKDCRYRMGDDLNSAKCSRYLNKDMDAAEFLVSGDIKRVPNTYMYFCATQRREFGSCGSEGKGWEPKT